MNVNVSAMDESGFAVEFSNQGEKKKFNPCKYRNPTKKRVSCAAPACLKMTTSASGVCSSHEAKYRWMTHSVDWIARIIPPGATRDEYLTNAPSFGDLAESLWSWANKQPAAVDNLDRFFFCCMTQVPGNIPDSTSLQDALKEDIVDVLHPKDIVAMALTIVDKCFPKSQYFGITSKNLRIIKNIKDDIPLRLTALLFLLGLICEEANRGDLWHKKRINNPGDAEYAGCYMAAGHYLYRRFTAATPKQIKKALRG